MNEIYTNIASLCTCAHLHMNIHIGSRFLNKILGLPKKNERWCKWNGLGTNIQILNIKEMVFKDACFCTPFPKFNEMLKFFVIKIKKIKD